METKLKETLTSIRDYIGKEEGTQPPATPEVVIPVVEPIVDPVVVVTEPVVPPIVAPSTETFFDTLLKKTQDPVVEVVTPPAPSEQELLAAKIADLETKLQEKDGILSKYEQNEYIKAIAKYSELENFDLKSYVKEIVGEDYAKMSYNDLIAKDLKDQYGLEGDSLARAVEKRVADFDLMEDYEQEIAHKQLANKFNSNKKSDSELIKAWDEVINSKQPAISPAELAKQQQELMAQIVEEDTTALRQATQAYVGQKVLGYEITAEDMKKVESQYGKYVASYVNEKNEFKSQEFAQEVTLLTLMPKLLDAAKEEGRQEVLKGRVKTDLSNGFTPPAPVVNGDDTTTKFLKKQGLMKTQ